LAKKLELGKVKHGATPASGMPVHSVAPAVSGMTNASAGYLDADQRLNQARADLESLYRPPAVTAPPAAFGTLPFAPAVQNRLAATPPAAQAPLSAPLVGGGTIDSRFPGPRPVMGSPVPIVGIPGAPEPARVPGTNVVPPTATNYSNDLDRALANMATDTQARSQLDESNAKLNELIQSLQVDPNLLADQALRATLQTASATPGGAAAQRGAVFNAFQQMPTIQANAQHEADQQRLQAATIAAGAYGQQNQQEIDLYRANLDKGGQAVNVAQDMLKTQLNLDQRDQEILGEAINHLAELDVQMSKIRGDNEFNFARLAEQDKWQLMEDLTQKLGISERGKQALQQIRAQKRKDWWDKAGIISNIFSDTASAIAEINGMGKGKASTP
jgi:hypothetical protein